MNDYRQLAVRYLKQNKKRTIITIAGTAFMVMILFVVVYFKDIKGLILYSFGLLKEMLGMD